MTHCKRADHDDAFTKKMQDLAPPVRISDETKSAIRMHLKYYMRVRKQRERGRFMASSIVLIVLMLLPMGHRKLPRQADSS